MKKLLIVEDNPVKLNAIRTLLEDEFVVDVTAASSISFAYATLDFAPWDLVILDMTFQASQGTGREISKEALAGIEVLQYIQRMGSPAPVIVATQHSTFPSKEFVSIDSLEELHQLLLGGFPGVYRETVRIDLASDAWKNDLRKAIIKIWGRDAAAEHSNRRR